MAHAGPPNVPANDRDALPQCKGEARPARPPGLWTASPLAYAAGPMRLKIVSCEIFHREVCAAAARSVNTIDLAFLPKGLHDIGTPRMRAALQEQVDAAAGRDYDAVLLGYGLCNNGVAGLRARDLPLVLPRAHDCITLFLGSRTRYRAYFEEHPGVYFHTTGWLERSALSDEMKELSIQHRTGLDRSYEEWVEAYGEDNARYLLETLGQGTDHYGQYTFIAMGVEPDGRFEQESRRRADEKGWRFEKVQGDMGLLQQLADGPWPDDTFLRVEPGESIRASHDERIVAVEAAQQPEQRGAAP